MNSLDRLTLHIRTHISGCTVRSVLDAGFTTTEIAELIQTKRVRLSGSDRLHYIEIDPSQEK